MTTRQTGLIVMVLGAAVAVAGGVAFKGSDYSMPMQVIGLAAAVAGSFMYRAGKAGDNR